MSDGMADERTIQEMQTEHGARSTEILSAWHAELDEIRAETEPEVGQAALLDRLTLEQRYALLREQKAERRDRSREKALEEYTEEHERFRQEHDARVKALDSRLYHVTSAEGARMVSDAARADEETLARMMDAAARSGNRELGRVVFGEAEARGLPELVARFYEMDPEARSLHEERQQATLPEVLDRQRAGIGTIVHSPDVTDLMPALRVGI